VTVASWFLTLNYTFLKGIEHSLSLGNVGAMELARAMALEPSISRAILKQF
jgi:hypothetical protein